MSVSTRARLRAFSAFLAAMCCWLVMSGCGGGGGWGAFKPTIAIQQGPSQTVTAGQTVTFTVTATGTPPFTYQWYRNGVAISGATSSSYTIGATLSSQNGSVYTVAVTNAGGTVMSAPCALTVNTPPAITAQPASQTIFVGQTATFAVTATGTAPLTYQWHLGGTAISGAISNSYTTPATTVIGSSSVYTVTVTNVAGSVTSSSATLTVNPLAPDLAFAPIAPQTYGASPFQVSATSASSGAVTYSVTSGPATISGDSVTLTGVGTVVLGASQAASGNYAAATATTSFTVAAEVPSLAFTPIAAQTYGASAFTVSASSASSGAVTYSVTSGPATISGNSVTLTGVGTVVLGASQAASGNYAAATASTSFTVTANVSITPITPANQTMAPGQQTFSATASGGPTNNLTWSASGGSITGNVWTAPGAAGTYTIKATSVDNPSAYVTTTAIITLPVITTQPASKNVCVGSSPSLTIGASYATSYAWSEGGSQVGTGPTLTLSDVTTASNGNYVCAVTNGAGSVVSNTATLKVLTPTTLTITSNPSSVSVYATQSATFSVSASGTGILSYQWYTGPSGSGTPIAGATSSTYTTGALGIGDNGTEFYATVSDTNCTGSTVTSSAATVTVTNTDTAVPPTIITQPTGQTAAVDGTATFSVLASGPGPLTYQWYQVPYESPAYIATNGPTSGVAVSGATGSTYTVPSAETAQSNDGDNYYVVVQNAYGTAQSIQAPLAVGNGILLQITGQPQTVYVASGSLASFSVTASCTGCTPAYQWYWGAPGATTFTALTDGAVSSGALSGATVSGATTSSLTLEGVPSSSSASVYYVVVTSTSDGTTPIAGTNAITSSNAALFVGSMGSISNLCSTTWVLNGAKSDYIIGPGYPPAMFPTRTRAIAPLS